MLLERVQYITKDNDEYFAQASRLYGDVYFTVNMQMLDEVVIDESFRKWIMENIPYDDISVETENIKKSVSIDPALELLYQNSMGAGFPNIIIDPDGVRRRIDTFIEYEGKYFPQLVMTPFLDWLGRPHVELTDREIVFKDAEIPGTGVKKDITIPRAEDGTVLINWPAKDYMDSFRHLSFYYLVLHDWQEADLIKNLKLLEDDQYFYYYNGDPDIFAGYEYAQSIRTEILNGGDLDYFADYRDSREYFFSEVDKFLNGDTEAVISAQIEDILSTEGLSEDEIAEYTSIARQVKTNFGQVRAIFEDYIKTRDIIKSSVEGSFCIIGSSATSTFDRGVNPFSKEYANVGTHASLMNMIIQDSFLDDAPEWISIAIAVLFSLMLILIIRKLDARPSIIWGIVTILIIAGAEVAVFLLLGVYIHLLAPVLSVFGIFIFMSFMKFVETAKEKSYIRNAFGHYLAPAVIENLIKDRDDLQLGGVEKHMTAMFTDIKGFSTFSENMAPGELVNLLNKYLTAMSNIIMEQGGTIDKYEGDAIIAFFGAPVDFSDHAVRACRAAVRMKKEEVILNSKLREEGLIDTDMLTRIGVNTGNMVVGNMGTAKKMDYTIMGNSVNLAARLEGVNKQYECWKLISASTAEEIGDEFLLRKLDRVRVVGINEPVRLYELIDETEYADEKMIEAVDIFHRGLFHFENKDWQDALELFRNVTELIPDDGPSGIYIKRCIDHQRKAPPANWDGVFNLKTK